MRTFKLVIQLGNEAMRTRNNVATALHKVALRLEKGAHLSDGSHKILDRNGNSVGTWEFVEEADISPVRRNEGRQSFTV